MRGRALQRLAQLLRDHTAELAALEGAETGWSPAHATGTIASSADYFEMYGGFARALRGETLDVGGDRHTFTRREPYGVIGVITPWNAPLNQGARAAAPALAVGNAVVIKPSEFTSSTTLMLGELAAEAGIPAGILNVVTGTGVEAGEPLVSHPGIGKVTFTGSVATGTRVATLAAARILPLTLELGGKSANVVFADVDIPTVAASILSSSLIHVSGQACSCLSRLLVQRDIHDSLVDAIVEGLARFVPGENLPPLITEAQYEKVLRYFDVAREEGAKCLVGGHPLRDGEAARGRFVPATVYTGVTNDMRIAREEIFGPVLCVIPFDDEDEAIAIANDSPYGLVAALWTNDTGRALRVAGRLEAGQVSVNGGRAGQRHTLRRLQAVRLRTREGLRGARALHPHQDDQRLDGQCPSWEPFGVMTRDELAVERPQTGGVSGSRWSIRIALPRATFHVWSGSRPANISSASARVFGHDVSVCG